MIEIKALSKRYKGASENALTGVSLQIPEKSFFGLLGPNGSGKTTLISILCGLLSPDSGDVWIDGLSVKEALTLIKPKIGLVPQNISLYPRLSLLENLKLFAAMYQIIPGKVFNQRIEEILDIVQLDNHAKQAIHTFSGGMKRRANLAVSLVHQPKIIFLDEPTANVDIEARLMIFDCLHKINRQGVTLVYTTHYLEEIDVLCSDVAVLRQGEVVASEGLNVLKARYQTDNLSDIYLHLMRARLDSQQ